jgi:hypothetical protein
VPHAATLYHPDLFAQLPALPEALKQRLACGHLSSAHTVAALRARAADVMVPPGHNLLALDLIHLYPDLNRVRLVLPEGMEGARAEELEDLLDCCRPVFAAQGMQLLPAQGRHWLLTLPASHPIADITTAASFTDPREAQGMPLDQALPMGDAGRVWRQLVSELQIELHHAEVNQRRIQNGRLSLNGVWLWGWSTSADYQSLEDQNVIWLDEAHALEQIEAHMQSAERLHVCSDVGCWVWHASETWKFWRRRQARRSPFAQVAQEGA